MRRTVGRTLFCDWRLRRLTMMDLRVEGEPLVVDSKTIKKLRSVSMAVDNVYRDANPKIIAQATTVNLPASTGAHGIAPARKSSELLEIWLPSTRRMRSSIGRTGKTTGYQSIDFLSVRRPQLPHGVEFTLPKSGGDALSSIAPETDVGRQSPVHSRPCSSRNRRFWEACGTNP